MKKIFNRQKDTGGGTRGPGKITPLTFDPPPSAVHSPPNAGNSQDGPMQFARHSGDEPDPWVLVSGAPGPKPPIAETLSSTAQPVRPRRRRSSPDEQPLVRPPPLTDSRTSSHASLPPGASPPVPGALAQPPQPTITYNHSEREKERDRDRETRLKKKRLNSQTTVSAMRTLEPADSTTPASTPPPLSLEESAPHEREKEKKKHGVFGVERKDRDRDKESHRERDKEGHKDRDKERGHGHGHNHQHTNGEKDQQEHSIRSMIGWWAASSSEDWSLALHICDEAGKSEANAKEAAKALRKTLKWGDPGPQLSAARLWAIMLRNPTPTFIAEATTPKFLSSVEDVITKPTTTPVVRSRVLEVLMGAAYAYPGSAPSGPLAAFGRDKGGGYGTLWRKVKDGGLPDEGIPFDPTDPMFNPPQLNGRIVAPPTPSPLPPASNLQTTPSQPPVSRPSGKPRIPHDPDRPYSQAVLRIIPMDEDVRRLFEECDIARGNCQLLNEALTFAGPEDLDINDVIKEYFPKCQASQALLASQIPWATAQATKLRHQRQEEALLRRNEREAVIDPPHARAEELLEAIVEVNQDLLDVIRVYEQLEQMGVENAQEREVQERSKHDTRFDRSKIEYMAEDGSFQLSRGGGGATSGPSRTPSPMPLDSTSPYSSVHDHGVYSSSHPSLHHHSAHSPHPIPNPPNSHNFLTPRAAPLGPRRPSPRSRSPSPDRRSVELNNIKNGLTSLESDLAAHNLLDDSSEDEVIIPAKPSAKAMGKKRMENFDVEEDRFDPDDIFKTDDDRRSRSSSISGSEDEGRPRWQHATPKYVYDALAERTKEEDRLSRKSSKA